MWFTFRFVCLLFLSTAAFHQKVKAQAAYLTLGIPSAADTNLVLHGSDGVRGARFHAQQSLPAGVMRWSWYGAGTMGPDSFRSWRPAVNSLSLTGYNQLVFPDTTNLRASALYSDSLGEPGLLPSIDSNTWLHWRITTRSKPARAVDEWMAVCTTAFEPAGIVAWQAPDTVAAGANARIQVQFNRRLSAGEWAGIEYDTLASLQTGKRLSFLVADSSGVVYLPCFGPGKQVLFRLFTSAVPSRVLDSLASVHGPLVSRLLSLAETGALTDSFYVRNSSSMQGNYLIPGACFSRLGEFIDTLNMRGMAGPVNCLVQAGYREKLITGSGMRLTLPGNSLGKLRFTGYGSGPRPMLIAGTGSRSMNSSSSRVDGIWSIHGTDNLSIEGFELVDSNAASSGAARMEYGFALFKDSLNGGCHSVQIINSVIRFMGLMTSAGPTAFEDGNKGISFVNARADALNQAFAVSGVKDLHAGITLENDTIVNAYAGILAKGMSDNTAPYRRLDSAISIMSCGVLQFGEEGIKIMNVRNAQLLNNFIHTHPRGNGPVAVPASERFGIVFTSGHLYSEAGIRIAGNRITLGGRSLSGSQHLFGIALRQNAGTGNRMEVTGNTIIGCTNQMAGSVFYGIRNTGQRHSLIIDSNAIHSNRLRAVSNSILAISNTAQIHQQVYIRHNRISRDSVRAEYTAIAQTGQARCVAAVGNTIDSLHAGGRFIGIQLHSIGESILADSNRVAGVHAAAGATGVSLRCLATTGASSGLARVNVVYGLVVDSVGNAIGIDINNGNRHKAELLANKVAGIKGTARITGIAIRSQESEAVNNRMSGLDGIQGSRARITGMDLFPGNATLRHNTIYLRGENADSTNEPAALRWSDSSGSRLLMENNVIFVSGGTDWKRPIAFAKLRSGLDTLRIHPKSAGNYLHAAGSVGPSGLYFNRADNTLDTSFCTWNHRLAVSGLDGLASGGSGDIMLNETPDNVVFLRRKAGWHWPRLIRASTPYDALGNARTNAGQQVPGALNDSFAFALERQFTGGSVPELTPLYARSKSTELACWNLLHSGRTEPVVLRTIAIAVDSALRADSLNLWVRMHYDTVFRSFGNMQLSTWQPIFTDSQRISCGDTLFIQLSSYLKCNPNRSDSVQLNLLYITASNDSFAAGRAFEAIRYTPRNLRAVSIAGTDTVCPGKAQVWSRKGGKLEPGGAWLWKDADSDSLLGVGDSVQLQVKGPLRLLLRGAGFCDTTAGIARSLTVYTLPEAPGKIRADRDTLCRGVANWFYPSSGKKGSGGVWSWYLGAGADSFLFTGDALRLGLQQPDTLFLRSEAYCGNSDWVKLPLAIRDARRYDWIGNISEKWHQVANWCDQLPGKDDTVRIGSKHAFMPRVNQTTTAGTLLFDTGAIIRLDSGIRLRINGALHAEGRQLRGKGAAVVSASADTAYWNLPGELGVDTLLMAGGGLRLSGGTRVKHIVLEQGVLICAPDTLTLENPAKAGPTNPQFMHSWIHGPVLQELGNDSVVVIPSGDAAYAMPVQLRFHQPGQLQRICAQYRERPGNDSGLNASEFGIGFNFIAGSGVWFLKGEPDSLSAAYDLQLWFDGHPDYVHNLQDGAFTILRRPDSSQSAPDWSIPAGSRWPGRDSTGTRVKDGFALRRQLGGFSQFSIAGATAVLPVGFFDFSLKLSAGQTAWLEWGFDAAAEITHFVVERMVSGKWLAIASLPREQETRSGRYRFLTPALSVGRHYFRVIAFNGPEVAFRSAIRFCDFTSPLHFMAYPNPFNDWLAVAMPPGRAGDIKSLQLFDLHGRCLISVHGPVAASHQMDTKRLLPGLYHLTIRSGKQGEAIRIPLVKVVAD